MSDLIFAEGYAGVLDQFEGYEGYLAELTIYYQAVKYKKLKSDQYNLETVCTNENQNIEQAINWLEGFECYLDKVDKEGFDIIGKRYRELAYLYTDSHTNIVINGKNTPQNIEKAISFMKSVKVYGWSYYHLGNLYPDTHVNMVVNGKRIPQNIEKAISLMKKAAEYDQDYLLDLVGLCINENQKFNKISQWVEEYEYHLSNKLKINGVQYKGLADLYIQGKGIPKNIEKAISLMKKATKYDQDYLFDLVELCIDENQKFRKVSKWLEELECHLDNKENINEYHYIKLAALYIRGKSIPQNIEKAISLIKKAAEYDQDYLWDLVKLCVDENQELEQVSKWLEKFEYHLENKENVSEHQRGYEYRGLADFYMEGKGVLKNTEKAISLIKKAAEYDQDYLLDVADSYEKLAESNSSDSHYISTNTKNIELMKKAAEYNPYYLSDLAQLRMYNRHDGNENKEFEEDWLKKVEYRLDHLDGNEIRVNGNEGKTAVAYIRLADFYVEEKSVCNNIEKAISLMKKAAEYSPYALEHLIELCINENQELEQISKWLEKLEYYLDKDKDKDKEYWRGEKYKRLAYFYIAGEGIPKNIEKAISVMQKAIECNQDCLSGLADLYKKIADFYMKGEGISQNIEKITYWLEKQAVVCLNLSDTIVMRELGRRYIRGTDVIQDYTRGMYWLDKALEICTDEDIVRKFTIAKLIAEIPDNEEKALCLMEDAANKSDKCAFLLGTYYSDGELLSFNPYKAEYWLKKGIKSQKYNITELLKFAERFLKGDRVPQSYPNANLCIEQIKKEHKYYGGYLSSSTERMKIYLKYKVKNIIA